MKKDFYTDPMDIFAGGQQSEHVQPIKQENNAPVKKKRTSPVHIYISDDLKAKAKASAEESDRSLSQWIIDAIYAYLKNEK